MVKKNVDPYIKVGSCDKVKWDKAWLAFIVQCVYQLCLWCCFHVMTLT